MATKIRCSDDIIFDGQSGILYKLWEDVEQSRVMANGVVVYMGSTEDCRSALELIWKVGGKVDFRKHGVIWGTKNELPRCECGKVVESYEDEVCSGCVGERCGRCDGKMVGVGIDRVCGGCFEVVL